MEYLPSPGGYDPTNGIIRFWINPMPIYKMQRGTPQYGFHQSLNKIQMMAGGFGNGKSACLCIKCLRYARDYPGSVGLMSRESYKKLNDTLRHEFFKWCPPSWIRRRPTKDDNTVVLTNSSIIHFRYIAQRGKQSEDGQTTSNLLSATYDYAAVDQVEDPGIVQKDILDLIGRLRGSTPYRPPYGQEDLRMPRTGPRHLLLACNPTHNWVYKTLVQPWQLWKTKGIKSPALMIHPKTGEPIFDLFEGSTYTNAANVPEDFIEGLEAMYKGQMRDRFLLGKWAAFEGLVYPEYDVRKHMITYDQAMSYAQDCIGRHVRLEAVEGYDFGLVSPSCYMLGFKDDMGRVVAIDGFYKAGYSYAEQIPHIQRIRHKYANWLEFDDDINADPDVFKRKIIAGYQSTGIALSKIFRDGGVDLVPANNDITAGIAKTTAYLNGSMRTPNPFLYSDEDRYPGPMFFCVDQLDWFHNEIENYFWKRNPQGQHVDEPMDKDDHAMNTWKYMITKLPEPSQIIIPNNLIIPAWMQWQEVHEE